MESLCNKKWENSAEEQLFPSSHTDNTVHCTMNEYLSKTLIITWELYAHNLYKPTNQTDFTSQVIFFNDNTGGSHRD